jgi:hypothetical protein
MRLPKSAILVYAAILSFIKKSSSIIFLYIDDAYQNVQKLFLGIRIFEILRVKSSFHCLLKYRRHLGFFSKKFDGFVLRAQKSIRIDHLMLQKQRGTTKRFFPT